MNKYFPEIKNKFGFGCMRFPMIDENTIDKEQVCKMVDLFIESGFNYFDTAHAYHNGMSETTLKECLTSRYPRDKYLLVNKLTNEFFEKEEDIVPFFEKQLEWCGVDYFDFYLMHAQTATYYKKFKACRAYEIAQELKAAGKIKHVGLSFHDSPEVLEEILSEHPEVEVVQIQFNYVDYNNESIQAKKCYDICRKYGKKIAVMEPVKGGQLVNMPAEAMDVFKELGDASAASYALRFAAGFEDIYMVLSGMSNMDQMVDNLNTFKDFKPLDEKEMAAIDKICNILAEKKAVGCTACEYCITQNQCPMEIPIPRLFANLNLKKVHNDGNSHWYYGTYTANKGKASDCIECGGCEAACPQHLPIIDLLKEVAEIFEN